MPLPRGGEAPFIRRMPDQIFVMSQLSPEEAKELLRFHSGRHEDVDHPKWESGFLGSLRPYRGLNEQNYHEVMNCLNALAADLSESGALDREVIADIWGICHLGRAWGVEPRGMLRSNNLITPEDVERLESWIIQISYSAFCLLDGCGAEVAFEFYDET